ncbi:MAG: hypothetical protein D6820_07475 [Lentisphaerae bacterium]|nr:MAG: hypothetical protein D6820_07475 [Lentisphaerota bacterium]
MRSCMNCTASGVELKQGKLKRVFRLIFPDIQEEVGKIFPRWKGRKNVLCTGIIDAGKDGDDGGWISTRILSFSNVVCLFSISCESRMDFVRFLAFLACLLRI